MHIFNHFSRSLRFVVVSVYLILPTLLCAQRVEYNLYLSIGFFNVRIGESFMEDRANSTIMTLTTGPYTDRLYSLRDTMVTYKDEQGATYLYKKITNENSRHDTETAHFSRIGDRNIVNLEAESIDGTPLGSFVGEYSEPVYDMLSMLAYARGLNSNGAQIGTTVTLLMVNGLQVVRQHIVYMGEKRVKADNGKEYNCIVLSIRDRKYGEERETLKAYVTNDENHLPIQLEIAMGFGKIRALYR